MNGSGATAWMGAKRTVSKLKLAIETAVVVELARVWKIGIAAIDRAIVDTSKTGIGLNRSASMPAKGQITVSSKSEALVSDNALPMPMPEWRCKPLGRYMNIR
jgi:hypothetical protein